MLSISTVNMRNPSFTFLCTFLVVIGFGACHYLEDKPELLKVYQKYRSSHSPKKLIPVGETLYHSHMNATMLYSSGTSFNYTEEEQALYERVNPGIEKWSTTLTSSTVGKDEEGPVDEADVIDYYETIYLRENGYYWRLEGNGIAYLRAEEGYKASATIDIKGSGHAVFVDGDRNISRMVFEVFQVLDYGDKSETTLTYTDLSTNVTEDRVKTKGFETSQEVKDGESDLLPVQVNMMESDAPFQDGDVTETIDGTVFMEGDDVTFDFDGEGNQWTTDLLSKQQYPQKALRHAVRSSLARRLLRSLSTRP